MRCMNQGESPPEVSLVHEGQVSSTVYHDGVIYDVPVLPEFVIDSFRRALEAVIDRP